jgi:hypothetical protein
MWDNASPGLKAKLQKEAEDEKVDILPPNQTKKYLGIP